VFWGLIEETFQDNLKVGMDFQSRVCAKFDAFFMKNYPYLIIKNIRYYTIISKTYCSALLKSTALTRGGGLTAVKLSIKRVVNKAL